jgi:hypothetical protein
MVRGSLIVPLVVALSACHTVATAPKATEPRIPAELRGGIETSQPTIDKALVMQKQGWEYVMPVPESPQAMWGNPDGRTMWWNGYWVNRVSSQYSSMFSSTEPVLKEGRYIGDGLDVSGLRHGGSPRRRPTDIEWLLSKSGGITPKP